MYNPVTKDEIDNVAALLEKGFKRPQIAKELGISENRVKGIVEKKIKCYGPYKKVCPKCGNGIRTTYSYCPHCGIKILTEGELIIKNLDNVMNVIIVKCHGVESDIARDTIIKAQKYISKVEKKRELI